MTKVGMRVLGGGLAVGSLGAVSWFIYRAFQSDFSFGKVQPGQFAGAVAVQLVVLLLLPWLWVFLLGFFGARPTDQAGGSGRLALYKAYSRSWLARYIPGRVWTFGGRMFLATKIGIPAETVVRSMALEIIFSYGMLTVLGVALILFVKVHLLASGVTFIVGIIVLTMSFPIGQNLIASSNAVYGNKSLWHAVRRSIHRVFVGEKPLELRSSIWGITAYGTHACLQLVFIVLLAQSFADLTLDQAITIAGAWALSSTLGYFTFLVPGGLGVRDGLALVLFSQVLDAPTSSLIVAASRIVTITTDLAFVGIVEVLAIAVKICGGYSTQPEQNHRPRNTNFNR